MADDDDPDDGYPFDDEETDDDSEDDLGGALLGDVLFSEDLAMASCCTAVNGILRCEREPGHAGLHRSRAPWQGLVPVFFSHDEGQAVRPVAQAG